MCKIRRDKRWARWLWRNARSMPVVMGMNCNLFLVLNTVIFVIVVAHSFIRHFDVCRKIVARRHYASNCIRGVLSRPIHSAMPRKVNHLPSKPFTCFRRSKAVNVRITERILTPTALIVPRATHPTRQCLSAPTTNQSRITWSIVLSIANAGGTVCKYVRVCKALCHAVRPHR